jgi:voltage-gated potassium channel
MALEPVTLRPAPPGSVVRRYLAGVAGLVMLLVFGTVGFKTIEGWSWWDSFYMVAISVTTVGYGEVHPLSQPGQVFATFVIFGGVGVGSYVLLTITRTFIEGVVEGSLSRALARRRMEREIPRLNSHTIVCGYGRLGHEICVSLAAEWRTVVVIEPDASQVEAAREEGFHCLRGDASDEQILISAGIQRAASIAVASSSDAINTYIVLSARELNPDLFILARANEEAAVRRLKAAGADQVVAPTRIGGQRMASILVRPGVVDFLDLAGLSDFPDLFIEEVVMAEGADLADRTLVDANYNKAWHVLVLAIKRSDGTRIFRPPANTIVAVGDAVILAGHREDLDRVEKAMSSPGA